jgi:hypothetical protein
MQELCPNDVSICINEEIRDMKIGDHLILSKVSEIVRKTKVRNLQKGNK